MANDLVEHKEKVHVAAGNRGVVLSSIESMYRFAQYVAASGLAPDKIKTPEQVFVAVEFGAELGLRPMQALRSVMIVKGTPALYGDAMLAVAQASGKLEDIVETCEGDESKPETLRAVCKVKRVGRPSAVVRTFSWEQARKAGLTNNDTYRKYGPRMLQFRARAFALRDALPDVLCGVYTVEEAAEIPGDESSPVFVDGAEQPSSDLDALAMSGEETAELLDGETHEQELPFDDYPDPNELDAQAVREAEE